MPRREVESVDPWRLTGQLACMAVFQAKERPCRKQKVKGAVQRLSLDLHMHSVQTYTMPTCAPADSVCEGMHTHMRKEALLLFAALGVPTA